MKKVLILLFMIFTFSPSVCLAEEFFFDVKCPDDTKFCSAEKKTFADITGITSLKVKSMEHALKKYVKNKYNNDVDFSIQTNNTKLKKGEFNKILAEAKKLQYKNYSVSDVKAETVCSNNKIIFKKNILLIPYDVPAKFSAVITNEDLQNITSSVNNSNINLEIKNSKINLSVYMLGIPIRVTMDLKIKNGEFVLENYSDKNFSIILKNLLYKIGLSTFCSFRIKISENTYLYLKVKEIKTTDDKIYLNGIFIIPHNCDITE